jgi:hypothetical protein
MFPVRYELNSYIYFEENSAFKGLMRVEKWLSAIPLAVKGQNWSEELRNQWRTGNAHVMDPNSYLVAGAMWRRVEIRQHC